MTGSIVKRLSNLHRVLGDKSSLEAKKYNSLPGLCDKGSSGHTESVLQF